MSEVVSDERKMPLLDHLIELRRRLIYCALAFVVLFFGGFYLAGAIFDFLIKPLAELTRASGGRMIYTALQEAFLTHIKVAFFAAAFVSFPVFASQVWMFVAPGLYRNERRAFLPFLIATPVLFFCGGALVYYFVMPLAWEFFLNFQTPAGEGALPIEVEPKIDEYLSLSMRLIFAFGMGFELPVVLVLLARAGIVSADGLARKRRYAIAGAFVVAAVLTPPDVISQIGLAIPLIVLYEISILLARMAERRRDQAAGEADMADGETPAGG